MFFSKLPNRRIRQILCRDINHHGRGSFAKGVNGKRQNVTPITPTGIRLRCVDCCFIFWVESPKICLLIFFVTLGRNWWEVMQYEGHVNVQNGWPKQPTHLL